MLIKVEPAQPPVKCFKQQPRATLNVLDHESVVGLERRGWGVVRTSERWPASLWLKSSGARMSRCRMVRSLLPLDSRWLFQAIVPTRALCPSILRTLHTRSSCNAPKTVLS